MILTVVIVNYNGKNCLPKCLSALEANTSCNSFEILVVDSGSTDDSWLELTDRFPHVRVLRYDANIGFCAGSNRGAEAGAGEYVAFVNFDGAVECDWDEALIGLLCDESISVAGGMLVDESGTSVEAIGLGVAPNMSTFGLSEGCSRSRLVIGQHDVAAVSGALMMLRREAFIEKGGFDEKLWMYGDEIDLCIRMGGRVVATTRSVIRHEVGHSAGPAQSPLRIYWSTRNRLINSARHLPFRKLIASVLLAAFFDLATIVSTRRRTVIRATFGGWRSGLREVRFERAVRTSSEKTRAAQNLVPLKTAIRQFQVVSRLRSENHEGLQRNKRITNCQ